VELDGIGEDVKSSQTLLSDAICNGMIDATLASGTTIGLFNSGSIRINDILRETITEYDVMRVLPFADYIIVLSVPGEILAQVLTTGMSLKRSGMFLSYTHVQTLDEGSTWLINGSNIATSGINYTVATLDFTRKNTRLNNGNVTLIQQYNVTQTKTLIDYLRIKYPPC
jgi:2',3'-cyclic-nucleotide 2'-phosphodiesterase (5'-nucleotidase family)